MHLQMCSIQLNQYEIALYFLQLSQNVMTDCLLISVFLPVPRTATEMDRTLHTDFRKFETSRDIKKYF